MGQNNLIQTNRVDILNADGSIAKSIYMSAGNLTINGLAIQTGSYTPQALSTQMATTPGTQEFASVSNVDITGLSLNVVTTIADQVVWITFNVTVQKTAGGSDYAQISYKVGAAASVVAMQYYLPDGSYQQKTATLPITIAGPAGPYTIKAIATSASITTVTQTGSTMSVTKLT